MAADAFLGTVAALGSVLPATLTAGALLEALSAILIRGLGLAAVTVPAGIAAATIHPGRAGRCGPSGQRRPGAVTSGPRPGTAAAPSGWPNHPGLPRRTPSGLPWSLPLVCPPGTEAAWSCPGWPARADHPVGWGPGSGKTTASERLAYLAARERRALCVIDGKGTDGLDEAIAAAVLAAWPQARIAAFPQQPVDLWRATPQQLANRLVAAWQFSDEAEFYEQPCSA